MNSPAKRFLVFAACSGAVAVGLGAFGAHVLEDRLAEGMMAIYRTGVEYHFYHTLALLATGLLALRTPSAKLRAGGWAFAVGTLLFSGSLYALAISGIRALGTITPFGGVLFIVGWILLALAVAQSD